MKKRFYNTFKEFDEFVAGNDPEAQQEYKAFTDGYNAQKRHQRTVTREIRTAMSGKKLSGYAKVTLRTELETTKKELYRLEHASEKTATEFGIQNAMEQYVEELQKLNKKYQKQLKRQEMLDARPTYYFVDLEDDRAYEVRSTKEATIMKITKFIHEVTKEEYIAFCERGQL